MMADLATAYIKLVPSLRGAKKTIEGELGGIGDSAGSKMGSGLEKGILGNVGGIAKKAAGIFAGAFTAKKIFDVGKASFDAYAEFEQLAGGAEKIFDQLDQKKILDDANGAFLTLNMSANEYLESINTVGATFAQTMGDEKGYETAKKGMQAISDFATGTGADIDLLNEKYKLITRSSASYQSIADQFAGILPQTSKDFLEQAKAAGFLKDEYEELTDVPVAEYQEAVTSMLEKGVGDIGLLGNTLAESTQTITGSMAMVRASWENLLTGISAGDEGMVQQAVGGLVNGIFGTWSDQTQKREGGLINNVLPVVQNIANAVMEQIPGIASAAASLLMESFATNVLGMDSTGAQEFVDGFWEKFDSIKEKAQQVFSEVSTAVSGFFGAFSGTADTGYLTVAIQQIQDIASQVWGFIEQNILPHADEIGEFIGNVANLLGSVATTALTVISNLGPVIPMIAGAVGLVSLIAPVASIIGAISGAMTFFTTVLVPALTMIQSVSGLVAVVTTLLGGPLTIIVAIAGALIALIATNENARAAIASAWEAIKAKGEELLAWFSTLPETISGFFSGLGDMLFEAGKDIIAGFLRGLKDKFEEVKTWVGGIGSWIASHKGPKQYDLGLLVQNGEWIMTGLQKGLTDSLPELRSTLALVTGEIAGGIGLPSPSGMDLARSSMGNAVRDAYSASAPMASRAPQVAAAQPVDGSSYAAMQALGADLRHLGIYLDGNLLVGGISTRMDRALVR